MPLSIFLWGVGVPFSTLNMTLAPSLARSSTRQSMLVSSGTQYEAMLELL